MPTSERARALIGWLALHRGSHARVARLGRARSSLFAPPPAPVLACTSYTEACAAAHELTGKKISLQAWAIVPKIREFQEVLLPRNVVEAHPELSFRAMAPGVGFASKKTARGAGQRIAALAGWADPARLLGEALLRWLEGSNRNSAVGAGFRWRE
jgi:predicted RNase H-like nuclease